MKYLLPVLLMSLIACDMPAQSDADRTALLGTTFPTLSGNSLARDRVTFPDAVHGELAVLVLVFKQGAQPIVNTWTDYVTSHHPTVRYFEIPMISSFYKPFSGFIDGGMRGGVPQGLHDNTVTFYGDREPYFRELMMPKRESCYLFLLDREGVIRYLAEGPANHSSATGLTARIEEIE